MEVFNDIKTSKNTKKFVCLVCNFSCCKKGDWNRHLLRQKHIDLTNSNSEVTEKTSKNINICNLCNKQYKSRNGLWNHKKNCNLENSSNTKPISSYIDKDELIIELLKQNKELLEIVKNGTANNSYNTTTNTTNTNSNNKAFNLQFFLNETCKDAMNITDFVNSIKLQLSDLEKFGEIGYVEGITNIITTNLKALDVTQRPVHCTDRKRETMYIKDDNQWEKEDDNKSKLRKAINKIADKNIRLLPQFREKYPEYKNSSSKISDKYDKMVIEAMVSDPEKEDKIIHNISKCTIIDKCSETT